MAAAAAEEVKLLGLKVSPYVSRVGIALNLKKVEYEFVEVEIHGQKSEILLQSNPVYKKVPVLLHQAKPICESSIIVQYIDEVWTGAGEPSFLPADPFDRSVARFWATYVDDKIRPCIITLTFSVGRGEGEAAAKAEAAEQLAQVFQLLEETFAKCSHGKDFFGGEAVGYLDIAVGSWLGWIRTAEEINDIKVLDGEKVPLLTGWAERFAGEKAVEGVIPETDVIVQYIKVVSPMLNAKAASR